MYSSTAQPVGALPTLKHLNMSQRITLFLQQPLPSLGAQDLQTALADVDWRTLGKTMGLEDEAVDDFGESVSWGNAPITLGRKGERPLVIHVWREADRIAEELAEVAASGTLPIGIKERLDSVKAAVGIEMGFCHFDNLFEVVAFEIAYALAERWEGVIWAPGGEWYDHDNHRWEPFE